jgi:hypothetical protein
MRLIFLFVLSCFFSSSYYSQALKKYSGYLEDSRPNGKLIYSYYEDPVSNRFIKEGPFSYNYSGQGDDEGGLKLTITGSYSKGLKTGTWNYTAQLTDYSVGSEYQTGTVTFVANYKNGYADGNWKQVRSYKTRNKVYRRGQYFWEQFGPVKTMTINLNFKNGKLVGIASINDDFANFKASGSFDQNSLAIGKWIVNDRDWGQNKELTYKEGVLLETIFRENSGVVSGTSNYRDNYESYLTTKNKSLTELEDSGIIIDTICGEKCAATSHLLEYFNKLSSYNYFPLGSISGDLTMNEGLKTGCELKVNRRFLTDLNANNYFVSGAEFYLKGDLLRALKDFQNININDIKPSQRPILTSKIMEIIPKVEIIIERQHSISKFYFKDISTQYDSIEIIYKSIIKDFKSKPIKEYNPTTYQLEEKKPIALTNQCDCNNPWNEGNLRNGIECINKNPKLFFPHQKAIMEGYLNYLIFLENEEKKIKKASFYININNVNHSIYLYDLEQYKNEIDSVKTMFDLSQRTIILGQKNEALSSDITKLNSQNKKKTLHKTYKLIENDFYNKVMNYSNHNNLLIQQTEHSLIQEKINLLYSKDTKQLEKQLKKSDNIDQMKKLIMDSN